MSPNMVDKKNMYFNFNYTDTLERVYNIPAEHIIYIHGKALREDQLIVGHGDKTLFQNGIYPSFTTEEERWQFFENYSEDIRIDEAKKIIKDYFESTYKDTDKIIEKNCSFFDDLRGIDEIYIYGHSFSKIDFNYFKKISQSIKSNCKWYLSYHNEGDYKNGESLARDLKLKEYKLVEDKDEILRCGGRSRIL